ncbi:MAG TPA: hypothetical protein PLZ43_13175 [bacterium]|nr:hypothetical protein [bacterium]
MFTRHIIMLITIAMFIGSISTGCDMNGKSASQLRQEELIAKLNQEKMDKQVDRAASTLYTFSRKADFIAEMQKELTYIQGRINQLSVRVEKAEDAVKTDAQPKIAALREELEMAKKYVETTDNADESSWETARNDFRKVTTDLRDSFEKTDKLISDKIGQ